MTHRIIVSESVLESALQNRPDTHFHYDPELYKRPSELKALLQEADALIVRNQTKVDAGLVEGATRLKVVGRHGVGLDNLDMKALKAQGIVVTWAPGANAVSVAEYVVGAMLTISRRFAEISTTLHVGQWDRQAAVGLELYGKTLGIVGLGDIGTRLAKRAHAFDMNLLASDPAVHGNSFGVQEYGIGLTDLESLLQEANYVSLHAPLLPTTQHLVNTQTLSLMKPTAYLINTARGGLVDEAALAAALRAGRLAGAALDVREHEPPGADDPLRGLPNVLLTPHIAGVTAASNRRVSRHVVADVTRVLRGEAPLTRAPGSA